MESFGGDQGVVPSSANDPPMYLEDDIEEASLEMMQIPMPLDIPFPSTGLDGTATALAAETEFAKVLYTDDLIDYSSSCHIRQRGLRRPTKISPVARYFPLVPPPSYVPPGNNIKSIQQQFALRLAFLRNPHPTRDDIVNMGVRFGLPSAEITAWFKGERHRFKKQGGLVLPGNASVSAWHMAMEGIDASTRRKEIDLSGTMQKRLDRAAELRRALTPYQLKRSRAWADEYANVTDANERAFRIGQLVDRQDVRLKKEFRGLIAAEPALGLRVDQEFKARKSCADATCSRDVVAERADSCWEFMRHRFGSTMYSPTEKYVDNDGNILLDASLLSGLEMMFMRHRDYLMALAHRFNVQESYADATGPKRPRTADNTDVGGATATSTAETTGEAP
ncbi:Aste57867_513 [Aphanomyces stellatus]|uniref:Aste57867_513 protein n=1 Tax=Aphanomyces stellatus TaxID=120398 RepID=A0A485K406_9STRA|nr:hypothetical protein As57867_000512 [Aphanomyces stellatus]VFT77738.1 Aste57867_513 [Aphanomyces stellatus]